MVYVCHGLYMVVSSWCKCVTVFSQTRLKAHETPSDTGWLSVSDCISHDNSFVSLTLFTSSFVIFCFFSFYKRRLRWIRSCGEVWRRSTERSQQINQDIDDRSDGRLDQHSCWTRTADWRKGKNGGAFSTIASILVVRLKIVHYEYLGFIQGGIESEGLGDKTPQWGPRAKPR